MDGDRTPVEILILLTFQILVKPVYLPRQQKKNLVYFHKKLGPI